MNKIWEEFEDFKLCLTFQCSLAVPVLLHNTVLGKKSLILLLKFPIGLHIWYMLMIINGENKLRPSFTSSYFWIFFKWMPVLMTGRRCNFHILAFHCIFLYDFSVWSLSSHHQPLTSIKNHSKLLPKSSD